MSLTAIQAQKIKAQLLELNPDLNVVIKGNNQVSAYVKEWSLPPHKLKDIADITRGNGITFGRSAANFRMTIS